MSLSLCHAPGSEPWWGPDPDEDEDDFLTLHCPEELDQAMQAWGDKVAAIQETTHDANVFALEVARLIYLPDSWQPSPACRQLTTRLDKVAAPAVLMLIVEMLFMYGMLSDDHMASLDFLELFAGMHEVTKAAWRKHLRAVCLEIEIGGKSHDFMGSFGYLHTIACACMLVPGGASLIAVVCSSLVWMNRGTSGELKIYHI